MKKFTLLFVIITLIFIQTTDAQIKKGSVFLGGNVGLSSYKTTSGGNTIHQNSYNFSPVVGKATRENLITGIFFNAGFQKNYNLNPTATIKKQQYGAGVFVRRYKPLGKSDFLIFLQGDLGFSYSHWKSESPSTAIQTNKRYNVNAGVSPGISYTASRRLQIEMGFNSILSLGYSSETNKTSSSFPAESKMTGFYLYSSLNNATELNIGFRWFINKG